MNYLGHNQLIGSLHGLRGIAALTVVVGHSRGFTGIPLPDMAAAMGVLLFFALSGFLMTHLYIRNAPTQRAITSYIRARVARIYPLFASVCLASTAIYYLGYTFPYPMDLNQLALHLAGMGSILTIWTISTEFQFYMLFIFFWLIYSKMSTNRDFLFISGLAAIILLLWVSGFPGGRILITGYLQVFLIGMIAALLLPYMRSPMWVSLSKAALPLLLLTYILAYFIAPQTIGGRHVYHSIPLVIAMGGIVLTAVLTQATQIGKFLSSKPLLWLGEVSFGIYLLHRPMMWFMSKLIPTHASLHWSVKLAVLLMLVGIISQLAYLLIEKPGRAFIRSVRFGRRQANAPLEKAHNK